MSEQKNLDSSLENAEKIDLTDEKSDKNAEKLSQDELQAISGGAGCRSRNSDEPDPDPPKSCGAIQSGARRYVCSKYII